MCSVQCAVYNVQCRVQCWLVIADSDIMENSPDIATADSRSLRLLELATEEDNSSSVRDEMTGDEVIMDLLNTPVPTY